MFRYLTMNAYIRVVKYHNTVPAHAERFEREIAAYSRCFSAVTEQDLDRFFETRKWHKEKPGLIPAVYDGLRNQYDVLYPILQKYGFCGWFFVPGFLPDVPVEEQYAASRLHDLADVEPNLYRDGRCFLNWKELAELSEHHAVCCHTGSHVALSHETTTEEMQREIVEAKRRIEEKIGRPVTTFAWKSGAGYECDARARRYLEEAGYRYLFGDLKIERIGQTISRPKQTAKSVEKAPETRGNPLNGRK